MAVPSLPLLVASNNKNNNGKTGTREGGQHKNLKGVTFLARLGTLCPAALGALSTMGPSLPLPPVPFSHKQLIFLPVPYPRPSSEAVFLPAFSPALQTRHDSSSHNKSGIQHTGIDFSLHPSFLPKLSRLNFSQLTALLISAVIKISVRNYLEKGMALPCSIKRRLPGREVDTIILFRTKRGYDGKTGRELMSINNHAKLRFLTRGKRDKTKNNNAFVYTYISTHKGEHSESPFIQMKIKTKDNAE